MACNISTDQVNTGYTASRAASKKVYDVSDIILTRKEDYLEAKGTAVVSRA